MHPFSILTLGIFVAGYITARWDLVTRLYELAIFAWDHGVVVRLRSPGWLYQLSYLGGLLSDILSLFLHRHEQQRASCSFPSSFSS